MDTSTTLIIIFIGILQVILIMAVVKTAQYSEEMKNALNEINYKLGGINKNNGSLSSLSSASKQDNSWVCRCGARNYGSKTCSKCGAKKGEE